MRAWLGCATFKIFEHAATIREFIAASAMRIRHWFRLRNRSKRRHSFGAMGSLFRSAALFVYNLLGESDGSPFHDSQAKSVQIMAAPL